VRPHDPWLSQGDIFASVPIPTCRLKSGRVIFGTDEGGPAVLLNDGCILDKRSGGLPALKRLNLAPLHSMADQGYSSRKAAALRNREINPPDPIYVNVQEALDIDQDGEAIALISETYALPANYFDLVPLEDPADEEDGYRAGIARTNRDTRVLTMEAAEVRLLQEKLALFWSGIELDPVCATCWGLCEQTDSSWVHIESSRADHSVTLTRSHLARLEAHGS
jgi:hypothetical protein